MFSFIWFAVVSVVRLSLCFASFWSVYYPHMPIGKVCIYRLLFVCFLYLYGYGFLRRG